MSGSFFFYGTLGLVIILNIVAIVLWFSFFSSRKTCETTESPTYCFVFVCGDNTPATRIDGSGNMVQSGQGVLDPNLFVEN